MLTCDFKLDRNVSKQASTAVTGVFCKKLSSMSNNKCQSPFNRTTGKGLRMSISSHFDFYFYIWKNKVG